MIRWVVIPVLLVHALVPLKGQVWQVFDMATAGLPSNTVKAIAHDDQGGTWVGTDWGLTRFDGSSWEVLQTQDGLPENDVRALAVDGQGRVWIGFFTQGLVVKDGDVWTQFLPGSSPMPSDQVHNITFDGQGNAWIATTNGLARTDLSEWRIYNNTDTSYNNQMLPGVNISDVAVRGDGLVCIGTLNAGFTYLTSTSVLVYNTSDDLLPDNTALGVAIDSDGDRWAACPYGGLLRFSGPYDNGLFFQFITEFTGIPTNALNDIVIDGDDRKIIATQSAGLSILGSNNATWTTYDTDNSDLPDNEVTCVSIAPDGAIWAGTANGGVARFDITAGLGEGNGDQFHAGAYPNPFDGRVTLVAKGPSGTMTWTLLDGAGRILRTGRGQTPGQLDLSFQDVPLGAYGLRIVVGNLVRTIPLFRR